MSITDELRRLLDERGIEYEPIDSVHSPNRRTLWGKVERGKGIFGMDAKYETIEFKKGMRLTISDCSPEQAVEATLGRGEVERLQDENERLRSCLSDSAENSKQIMHEAHVQEEENAKLRELAVLNWEWAHSCCGNNCKMQTNDCGYQIDRECNYEREIWDRMRELGVEV